MAHNLSFEKNVNGDFVSKYLKPWHGFGTIMQENVSFQDALTYGGLDYTVEKSPNIHRMNDLEIVSESSFFTWRTDTKKVLGVVGDRYTPVQNTDALSIVEQFPYQIETAGVLKNGAICFVCMKSDKQIVVKGKDMTEMYLLFTNSFDGTTPISVLFTPIRVVCNNTLTAAIRGAAEKYTFRHTASATEKVREFAKVMGLLENNVTMLDKVFNVVAEKQINPLDFMSHVFLTKDQITAIAAGRLTDGKGDSIISTRKKNIMIEALKYYETGAGQPEWKGTAWGAFNAVTGYMGTKDFEGGEDQMLSVVFNANYKATTDKAMELALNGVPTSLPVMETLLFN
jgi:phage/plasmid-like protein (TIGR03299 family)